MSEVEKPRRWPIAILLILVLLVPLWSIWALYRVVPLYARDFGGLGEELPLLTRLVIAASNYVSAYGLWCSCVFLMLGLPFGFLFYKIALGLIYQLLTSESADAILSFLLAFELLIVGICALGLGWPYIYLFIYWPHT